MLERGAISHQAPCVLGVVVTAMLKSRCICDPRVSIFHISNRSMHTRGLRPSVRRSVCRSAKAIQVKDHIPDGFELIEGKPEASFDNVYAGSSVGIEYIVIPKTGNKQFQMQPAVAQYLTASRKEPWLLLSTQPFVQILSTRQNMELYAVEVVRP
jgi:hypothetical protein